MYNGKDDFNQIKRDLVNRVSKIEDFIKETEEARGEYLKILRSITIKLNGDYLIDPPIIGHEQRIINLEKSENERTKTKDNQIKWIIGSVTIATGSFMMWLFNVLRDAFITKNH